MAGSKPTRWRRALCVFLTLLALFLIGTVVVLTTVVEYFGVDWRDVITEPEMRLYERLALEASAASTAPPPTVAQAIVSSHPLGGISIDDAGDDDDLLANALPIVVDSNNVVPHDDDHNDEAFSGTGAEGAAARSHDESGDDHDLPALDRRSWLSSTNTSDVADFETTLKSPPEPRIPRIIHATWKTDVVPERWQKYRQACMEMHPDYEFKLWSDASSREFIATHYPWFLSAFDNYVYPIQRADAIRYFVLHHFGGIYMDLDVGCKRPMDPLLYFQVILPATIPVGVSNDIMFSEKGHPFMDLVIHNLVTFNHQYGTNYPTVMFSTGPMFLSAQYGLWPKEDISLAERQVRVLPRRWYGKNAPLSEMEESFFTHYYGSSWHADDAGFITFLGKFGMLLMYLGASVVVLGVGRLLWSKRYGLKKASARPHGPIALPFHLEGGNLPHARPGTPGSARPDSPFQESRSGSPLNSRRPTEIGPQAAGRGVLYYLPVWLMPQDGQSRSPTPNQTQPGPWSHLFYPDDEEAHRYTPIPSYSRPPSPSNNSILHAPGSVHDGAFNGTPLKTMYPSEPQGDAYVEAPAPSAAPPPDYSTLRGWSSFFRSPRASILPLSGQQSQNSVHTHATSPSALASRAEYFSTEHTAKAGSSARSPLPPHYTPSASPSCPGSPPSPSSKHAADGGVAATGGDHPASASSATTLTKGNGELRGRGMVRSNSGQHTLGNGSVAAGQSSTPSTSSEKAYIGGAGEGFAAAAQRGGQQQQQQQQHHQPAQTPQQQQAFALTHAPSRIAPFESGSNESEYMSTPVDDEVHRLLHEMTPDLAKLRARDN